MSVYFVEEWHKVGFGGTIKLYDKVWKAKWWSRWVRVDRPKQVWLVDSRGLVYVDHISPANRKIVLKADV